MANKRSKNAALHMESAKASHPLTDKAHHANTQRTMNGPKVTASSNALRHALGSR
jgi:hypothetical protein